MGKKEIKNYDYKEFLQFFQVQKKPKLEYSIFSVFGIKKEGFVEFLEPQQKGDKSDVPDNHNF